MANAPSQDDGHAETVTNPLERQRKLMELLSQETRHSIVQALLGHPHVLASADEIDYLVANKSKKTVDEQLAVLVEADILTVYEHPANESVRGLPHKFYGFTEFGVEVLSDFNYLKTVPMVRALYQKTRKSEKTERHENAPRPALPEKVRAAFRLNDE